MPPPGYEPFLAMVLENPADDGPRMVYADWLEEHGDPRGEFIRIQLEMSHLDPTDRQWDRLNDRQSELRTRHYQTWITELPLWARKDCDFERGFVREVRVWTPWLDHFGPELSATAPIERVILLYAAQTLDAFAAGPGVRHLKELAILDDRMTPNDLRLLCRSETALAGLEALQFMGMDLLDSGALMLSLCPQLSRLRQLKLVRCAIQHRGVLVLTDEGQSNLKNLTWLDLSDNDLGNDALYCLTSSPMMGRLERLHWNDNALTNSSIQFLVDSAAPSLTHLELAGNHIGDAGARLLMQKFPNLQRLNLSRNPLTRGMQMALFEHYGNRVRLPGA